MLRDLTNTELSVVAGGITTSLTEVIPALIPGYILIGWTEQIVRFDTYEWAEYPGIFTKIIHKETYPVIDIQPLYAPLF